MNPAASSETCPVVIVGAGPTGITAATLLGQYGIHCLVLDRWDGVYPQPRAVHLDDEIYRILAELGLADEFAAISRPAHGLRLVDRHLRVLAEFDRGGEQGRHGHPRANMFDQPDLEHLLRTNLKDQPSVTVRGNAEVTDVAQDGHDRIRLDFTDRVTGAHESVLATYVLGCDGANSVVRSSIGAGMEDMHFEQRWLVVDVATSADLDQWEGVHQVCDAARAATYMRIGDIRYRWEFQLLQGETADDFASLQALLPMIRPWVKDTAISHLELVRVAEYTFRAQVADRWRDGNVFVLGDAAHLTPPFIGQGMGAGLRDAMNLTWKIAGVLAGDLPASVLETYEAERKPHARALIRVAKLMGVLMTQGGRAGDTARRLLAPRLHHIPGIRSKILDSETPALARTVLVRRSSLRRSPAGRLAPNAFISDGRRLDQTVGHRFAVVSARPLTAAQRSLLTSRGAVAVEPSVGSPLHAWLIQNHVVAALVRPDRTVMFAGRDLTAVCAATPTFRPQRIAGSRARLASSRPKRQV
ncbi:bifunctional 3-(3-hydroxy-phenyl)propionate/3-hydroxycinnamic acid hydroxylase MhpA [Nocardioides luteus]|uniref:3-(3-hydroxyphenyl)propionate hydroxylase n=1 Tax=Nocardioides luteus TaxID=1844 RepID=A0A1J4NA85_9ACTN|nr:bifunctional 3-(3-hydroxy-phenyl)propionate/3-hydroxycinnamic acid hydroxylase [Nocardioides luteus]OIJ27560.1 3-(3-hydroxyphenyl)propionate hydroxylase [Nocardioides luteus]